MKPEKEDSKIQVGCPSEVTKEARRQVRNMKTCFPFKMFWEIVRDTFYDIVYPGDSFAEDYDISYCFEKDGDVRKIVTSLDIAIKNHANIEGRLSVLKKCGTVEYDDMRKFAFDVAVSKEVLKLIRKDLESGLNV